MASITVGSTVGSYEILSLLGKGGMGEVFRARDLKLKREVAIKTLPAEFGRDPDRVSRFQREAETLATLRHSNIGVIHDLQETEGVRYLVLELVEGPTLAEMIAQGPIPVDDALDIARQVCEALEAAHERGIVHRDLKPANIKVMSDGSVKVLDFGLAKVSQQPESVQLSNSPTLMNASVPGLILGTAAYMSPEQAKGKEVDRTADVWAFGCVLYEMLGGKLAFPGESPRFSVSPNGRYLVFPLLGSPGHQPQLWLRRLDSNDVVPIAGTEGTPGELVACTQNHWTGRPPQRSDGLSGVHITSRIRTR